MTALGRRAGSAVLAVLLSAGLWGNTETGRVWAAPAEKQAAGQIAITFDDGPHPTHTAEILDLCAEYGVHATFFVIGENVRLHPELLEREIAEGHEVGNHTFSHPNLSKMSCDAICTELLAAENAIYEAVECHPHLFRPPGGATSSAVRAAAKRMDYQMVFWTVDTRDWSDGSTVKSIVETVRQNVRDGSVILFHDYVSGRDHTLDALRILLPELKAAGYCFVTVSQLYGTGTFGH